MAKLTGTHRKNFVGFGSINFPKLMKHVGYRTNSVRELVFERPEKYPKSTANVMSNTTAVDDFEGPSVDFGYEKGTDFLTRVTDFGGNDAEDAHADNQQWYESTPALHLPGLKAVQNPIVSRGGKTERAGFRQAGECIFYMPSLSYIQQLPNFKGKSQFTDLEVYDKLIDKEHIVIGPDPSGDPSTAPYYGLSEFDPVCSLQQKNRTINRVVNIYNSDGIKSGTAPFYMSGTDFDRIQFRIRAKSYEGGAKPFLNSVSIHPGGSEPVSYSRLLKQGVGLSNTTKEVGVPLPLGASETEAGEWVDIDFNYNGLPNTNTTSYWHTGGSAGIDPDTGRVFDQQESDLTNIWLPGTNTYYQFRLENALFDGVGGDWAFRLDELGGVPERYVSYINIEVANGSTAANNSKVDIEIDPESICLYREAEWRVESIKDYRDEYMEVHCTRVRGERPSIRRAYGGRPTKQ
tara:strand:- start:254 stop:1636 length:1383 start_codon:yes stop_codon:yes gene_type:complete